MGRYRFAPANHPTRINTRVMEAADSATLAYDSTLGEPGDGLLKPVLTGRGGRWL